MKKKLKMKKKMLLIALSALCLVFAGEPSASADSMLAKAKLDELLQRSEMETLVRGRVYAYAGEGVVVDGMISSGILVRHSASSAERRFLIKGVGGGYKKGDDLKQGFYVYVKSERFGVGADADKRVECFEVASSDVVKAIQKELNRRLDGKECPTEEEVAERLARAHKMPSPSFAPGTIDSFLGIDFMKQLKVGKNDRPFDHDAEMFVGKRYRSILSFSDHEDGEEAGVLRGTRSVKASAQTHVVYQISGEYRGSLQEAEKLMTEFCKVKPMPCYKGDASVHHDRSTEQKDPVGYKYELGDVTVFVSNRKIIAVNKVLLELAVEESEQLQRAARNAGKQAALDALSGRSQKKKKGPIVLPGFRSYKFGQKFAATRMTPDMRQEGGIAIKPVSLKYRKFTTIELGYAINGKQLCTMRLCADYPADVDEQIVKTEWENVRRELEGQLNCELTVNGRVAEYEDEKHWIKLWYAPATKTVRSTRLVGMRRQTVLNEVNVMGLYLQLTDKALMPKTGSDF